MPTVSFDATRSDSPKIASSWGEMSKKNKRLNSYETYSDRYLYKEVTLTTVSAISVSRGYLWNLQILP